MKQEIKAILDEIKQVIRGQDEAITLLLAGLISGEHMLLEDYPGTGKTTLAKAMAIVTDLPFNRIQFTPDLLPSDITGVSIYDQQKQSFKLYQGPIFTTILLADEINRASPRTQSALLEAMAEGQVSIDGVRHTLDPFFCVIATQNPIETSGTFPLPEAQMDRFALQFELGYVSEDDELAMLNDQEQTHPLTRIKGIATRKQLDQFRQEAMNTRLSDDLKRYILALVRGTRKLSGVKLGASPRAGIALMKLSRVIAYLDGGEFVTPDQIKSLAIPVLAHRLVFEHGIRAGREERREMIHHLLRDIAVPV